MRPTKSSIIITTVILSAAALFADPILVGEWNWTDVAGTVHEYGVYEYKYHSWDGASSRVSDGWHMATITSQDEQDALIAGLSGLKGEYWIGACQAATTGSPEDDWAWVTGETWSYKNWAAGEPNDAYGAQSEQHLAVWSKWGENTWLWNDEGARCNITGYVVERSQSVPEPGMMALSAIGFIAVIALSGINRKIG